MRMAGELEDVGILDAQPKVNSRQRGDGRGHHVTMMLSSIAFSFAPPHSTPFTPSHPLWQVMGRQMIMMLSPRPKK